MKGVFDGCDSLTNLDISNWCVVNIPNEDDGLLAMEVANEIQKQIMDEK